MMSEWKYRIILLLGMLAVALLIQLALSGWPCIGWYGC